MKNSHDCLELANIAQILHRDKKFIKGGERLSNIAWRRVNAKLLSRVEMNSTRSTSPINNVKNLDKDKGMFVQNKSEKELSSSAFDTDSDFGTDSDCDFSDSEIEENDNVESEQDESKKFFKDSSANERVEHTPHAPEKSLEQNAADHSKDQTRSTLASSKATSLFQINKTHKKTTFFLNNSSPESSISPGGVKSPENTNRCPLDHQQQPQQQHQQQHQHQHSHLHKTVIAKKNSSTALKPDNIAHKLLKRNNDSVHSLFSRVQQPLQTQSQQTNNTKTPILPNQQRSLFKQNSSNQNLSNLNVNNTSLFERKPNNVSLFRQTIANNENSASASASASEAETVEEKTKSAFVSSDEDSEWMDSDWTSTDSETENDEMFKREENRPILKRSLLSGLLRQPSSTDIDKASVTIVNNNKLSKIDSHSTVSDSTIKKKDFDSPKAIKGNTNPRLLFSPKMDSSSKTEPNSANVSPNYQTISPTNLQITASKQLRHLNNNATFAIDKFNSDKDNHIVSSDTFVNKNTPEATQSQSRSKSSKSQPQTESQMPPPVQGTGIGQMVNKSVISLTSYFASNRRPPTSNAPATAAHLLPTALSTHMFLPTRANRAHWDQTHPKNTQNKGDYNKDYKNINYNYNGKGSGSGNGNGNGKTNVMQLTNANLAQFHQEQIENQDKNEPNGIPTPERCHSNTEYASSVHTGTSSIDIPGAASRLKRERERKRRKEEQEIVKDRVPVPDGNIELEILSKELPRNLVENLHIENRMLGHIIALENKDDVEPNSVIANKNDLTNIRTVSRLSLLGVNGSNGVDEKDGNDAGAGLNNNNKENHKSENNFKNYRKQNMGFVDSMEVAVSIDDDNYHTKGW